MAYSKPIWMDITACTYKGSKSYGAQKEAATTVRVGTSAQNSHVFVKHCTTHRQLDNGDREFRFYLDGVCVKRCLITKKTKTQDPQQIELDPSEVSNA